MSRTLKYVTPDELAEIMKSRKESAKDYLVVDVRDDDFSGGNVKGCVNTPSSTFYDNVEDLVEKTKDVPMLIFHCTLSQQRYAID
jgi:rhodanese-related sulfurtransferase